MPRIIEWIIAFLGGLVLLPLFGILSLVIILDSRGPVFFRPQRVGKSGKRFRMVKFRTMTADAASQGPPITVRTDRRITRVGAFLRKTKLDELPQLFNILFGDMGFVGPRPEDPSIAEKYPQPLMGIFRFRPGITSPASMAFRAEEEMIPRDRWESVYFGEILPKKVEADVAYMEKKTVWSDFQVIIWTVFHK
jgi:lipopolysaccharide/colanic/teichoic acid biosynthesis glycosyltransferase